MNNSETIKKIASLNQATGKFEQLATAVLRKSNPRYEALIHTGVNTDGQPIKGPLDGICFISGAKPPHMISVHHTTGDRDGIRKKWLLDPSTVNQRKKGSKRPLAGDVLKTAEIYTVERKRTPDLEGTLVLTVTSDPPEDVIRDAEAIAREAGFLVDLWPVSRIADFLDTNPEGQYLRRKYLGITEERLSASLLRKLSKKSLENIPLLDNPNTWVKRELDNQLKNNYISGLTLVSAESGQGKSVACYKYLSDHIDNGCYGLVIPHKNIIESATIEQVIRKTLKESYPSLMDDCGVEALKMSSIDSKFLIIIEDINKSGQPEALIEKLAGWHKSNANNSWQILCPVWPQFLTSLNKPVYDVVKENILSCIPFSMKDGVKAIKKRYELASKTITNLEAEEASIALGHDPLLIGLYDVNDRIDPQNVIKKYIHNKLNKLEDGDYLASDHLQSIIALFSKVNEKRVVQLSSLERLGLSSEQKKSLKHIHIQGQIFRFVGDASSQTLIFRHDRVRDWLASSAIENGLLSEELSDDFLAEPYYAKVIGLALNRNGITVEMVAKIKSLNPLALFYSLQNFSVSSSETEKAIVACIKEWLKEEITHTKSNENLRWETLKVLSQTDSRYVLEILEHYNDEDWWYFIAGFRNGDLNSGVNYFYRTDLSIGKPEEKLVDFVLSKSPEKFISEINDFLKQGNLSLGQYSGILILAGLTKSSDLFDSLKNLLETIVKIDDIQLLGYYLWACAHCCGDSPSELLGPIIKIWASLSDEKNDGHFSDRNKLAGFEVRTAFQRFVPENAIGYFIEQAKKRNDLSWEISYMLNQVDHPDALVFLAETNAQKEIEAEKNGSHCSVFSAIYNWKRSMEYSNLSLSSKSKDRLYGIWSNQSLEKHLRKQAFELWSFSHANNDLARLKKLSTDDLLLEPIIRERVIRNDMDVLPQFIALIEKGKDFESYWWQFARDYWADELTELLDEELEYRSLQASKKWEGDYHKNRDFLISELIARLPNTIAESLLIKYWDSLKFSFLFIQIGLFISTDRLVELVEKTIQDCPEPRKLFEFLDMQYGINYSDRPSVTSIKQLEVLIPYLGLIREKTIESLWDLCNEHKWFAFRKEHLDKLLQKSDFFHAKYLNKERAIQSLNYLSSNENYHHWDAERWAEEYLKTGATPQDVFDVVFKWIKSQEEITLQVIKVALAITVKIGDRTHYQSLMYVCSDVMDYYEEYFENAYFLLRKKQLH